MPDNDLIGNAAPSPLTPAPPIPARDPHARRDQAEKRCRRREERSQVVEDGSPSELYERSNHQLDRLA